jgi:CheY-like chemotaxis protein
LIVDDNAASLNNLSEIMTRWRASPVCVSSARAAFTVLLAEREARRPLPLMLVDAQMPDEDGFSLVRRIRAEPGLAPEVIMMLTSSDLPAESGRCCEHHVGKYLVKPVREADLREAIVASTGTEAPLNLPISTIAAAREPEQSSGARVLLVEDNLTNQKLALRLLAKKGYSVVVAGDGLKATEEFRRQQFDLVLMDIQMPHMGGYEATGVIRELERGTGGRTPIIALTAHAMKGDHELCLQAGMDDYIAKPVQAQELFYKIEQLLSLHHDSAVPTALHN